MYWKLLFKKDETSDLSDYAALLWFIFVLINFNN